ncbi:hypothetical protein A2U01_0058576, partial [Trifolium medium]|nr:hypothetical protein [Trifolium medium]
SVEICRSQSALGLPPLRRSLLIRLSPCDCVRFVQLEIDVMPAALLRGLLARGCGSVLAVDPFAMF